MERAAMSTRTTKSDSEIQQDVYDELEWDSRVEATHIGVVVENGVVTLRGTVRSHAERLAAQEAAHRVAGVLDVANDIDVKIPGSLVKTDTELAQAVRYALMWDVFVPHERIQSTVAHGWVTLDGTVENWQQRGDAERAIRNLPGVRGIVNNLIVVIPDGAPRAVQQAIEAALARHAIRAADRITVTVQDGTVILSGRVGSWAEKRAVVGAAGHAPGIRAIHDDLRVDPLT
jgi:osmotically-inducible protein OsmY